MNLWIAGVLSGLMLGFIAGAEWAWLSHAIIAALEGAGYCVRHKRRRRDVCDCPVRDAKNGNFVIDHEAECPGRDR